MDMVKVSKDVRPGNREELRGWVKRYLGLNLANEAVCGHHDVPLDYLEYVFLEKGVTADVVVWAPRGGGKTMLGAVATLLDMLFKPGVQVRILGGSREQSEKMYGYLAMMVERNFGERLVGKITKKGFALDNGSTVEILTQSETAVRGMRVQKLRCDEVELFKKGVWEAAQLTTRTVGNDECGMTNDEANPNDQMTKDETGGNEERTFANEGEGQGRASQPAPLKRAGFVAGEAGGHTA